MKGLYIHIPFCKKKCKYCDFVSFSGCEDLFEKYIDAIGLEMAEYKGESVDTVFVGGGTPTLLSSSLLKKMINYIYDNFNIDKNAEFTVEANPKTLSEEKLKEMRNVGVNRLSIGVQSFSDKELLAIGRIHNSFEAKEAVELAEACGFSNINLDIIFSLPYQTKESFYNTVKEAVSLKPQHISCYSLILEEGTPLYEEYRRGQIILPDEETDRENYKYVCDTLKRNGFLQYEISNFSKPGFECRHNLKYWNCEEYIGIGVAAHSYYNGIRYFNTECPDKYLKGEYREEKGEKLTLDEQIKEFIIMGLRKSDGIKKSEFKKRFKKDFELIYKKEIDKLKKAGLMSENKTNIWLTFDGINISNSVLCEFI